jgi:hypothetical protein
MALVLNKFVLQVNIADNSGEVVPRYYEVPEGVVADFDEFSALIPAMITAVNGVTSGLIVSYRATEVYVEDTVVLPASGVENENQAFFSGKIAGDPTDSGTLSVPAADPAIFVSTSGPGANVVDIADAAVQAFITLFDGSPGWTISDGENWVLATVSGKRRHPKNTNG